MFPSQIRSTPPERSFGGRKRTTRFRNSVVATLTSAVLTAAVLTTAPSAAAATKFQLPFPCGQTWTGATRPGHDLPRAIDFNRLNDLNDPVVASARGTVMLVRDLGNRSYGRYVVVDHGGGWTTLYAHLASTSVKRGQNVAMGARVGTVGSSGTSSPHLHYEQRLNGKDQRLTFDGVSVTYYSKKAYKSRNSCGPAVGAPGTITTAGSPLTVRSGPGTGYAAVGNPLPNGTKVTVSCQTHGTSVTGTYGTTTLWDRIGTGRYVSDAYVNTGSNERVAPPC